MKEKVITVDLKKSKIIRANSQWRYNYGQKLKFTGVELPPTYQVHFSNSVEGEAKTQIGDSTGVLIPPEYFIPGSEIHAWIHLQDEESGVTGWEIIIPILKKALPTDQEPDQHETTVIDEAINALNNALETVDDKIDDALSEAKESGEFDGEPGAPGNSIWYDNSSLITSGSNVAARLADLEGRTGVSPAVDDIVFAKAPNSGDIDTMYLIHRIHGSLAHLNFVANIIGPKGDSGYSPWVRVSEIDGGHRVTIYDLAHSEGQSFDVMDGAPGQKGDPGTDGSNTWTINKQNVADISSSHVRAHTADLIGRDEATPQAGDLVFISDGRFGSIDAVSTETALVTIELLDDLTGEKGDDGFSPTVQTQSIEGGTRVIITDAAGEHPFDIMNGSDVSEIVYFYGYVSNPALSRVSIQNFNFYNLRDCINAGKTPVAIISISSRHPAKDSYDQQAIENEMEYLVMPLAEWYKDKADSVPGEGDVGALYPGEYANFASSIQNISYTLKLEWDVATIYPLKNDWIWTLVPVTFAKDGDIDRNVVCFNFEYDGTRQYDDGGYSVRTSVLPSDIMNAANNGYAVFARYIEDGVTYILSPTDITDTYGEFAVYNRQPVIDAPSPEELGSVYRLSIDYHIDRFNDGIVEDMVDIWRVYWHEVIEGSGDLSAYRTAEDQDIIDQQITASIPSKTSDLTNDSGFVNAAAAASAAPVQSVNDMTGIVQLDIHNIPSGGMANQILRKNSATNYDAGWGNDDIVAVSSTQPVSDTNLLWIKSSNSQTVQILTKDEVEDLVGEKLDKNQGISHAGEFCVVGSDGNITTVTMTAWQGGAY